MPDEIVVASPCFTTRSATQSATHWRHAAGVSLSLSRWLLNIVVAGRATPAQETIGVPKGMDKWLTPLQWLAVHKRPQSNEGNMAMTLPALEALPADVCRYTHRPDDPIWSFFFCVRVGGPVTLLLASFFRGHRCLLLCWIRTLETRRG